MKLNSLISIFQISHVTRLSLAVVTASLFLSLAPVQQAVAQGAGNLIVAPTRVVLEGRTRSAQLTLSNTGSASATYRISIVNIRMNEDGSVTEITEPDEGQLFAEKLFRYSPRQITLAPGGTQAVRILLRKPKDLADGEYRSHIFFRAVPDEAGQSVNQEVTSGGLQIRLIPIYGVTLPIIVRHGKLEVSAALSELKVNPPSETSPVPTLSFRISREGNRSAFGDLTATFKSGTGEETIVGQTQRLAVYTPNKSRVVSMPLRVPEGVSLANGELNLTYKTIEDEGGALMGEATLKLP